DPIVFEESNLFDSCLGLEGYQDEDFFEKMTEDLALELDRNGDFIKATLSNYTIPESEFTFSGGINDMCYSETIDKTILLSTSGDLGSYIAIIEYDIQKR